MFHKRINLCLSVALTHYIKLTPRLRARIMQKTALNLKQSAHFKVPVLNVSFTIQHYSKERNLLNKYNCIYIYYS